MYEFTISIGCTSLSDLLGFMAYSWVSRHKILLCRSERTGYNPDVYNIHCSYSKQLLSLFDPLAHMKVGGGVERNGFL